MSGLKYKAGIIHERVEKLISVHSNLQSEIKHLENENLSLKEENGKLKSSVKELEEKIKILKIAGVLSGSEENNSQAKNRINELVREIDRCIALLNR
jgi:phage shock protein A